MGCGGVRASLMGRCQGFYCGASRRELASLTGQDVVSLWRQQRMNAERVEVAIVGGGPAGLSAAIELRRRGSSPVVVFEREADAGGIPRYADHLGFGCATCTAC